MGGLAVVGDYSAAVVDAAMFASWVSFIDASARTVEAYRKNAGRFLEYLADNGISQPDASTVIEYKGYLMANYKAATVQAYIVAVKRFFAWTEERKIYPDIAKNVKGAKLDTEHKKDYLTVKQARQVLGVIDREDLKGKRDYAIISLMMTTGLREISVIRANIGDIRPAGDDMALYYQGKGHAEKAKYVKLAEPVEDALREYLAERGEKDAGAPLFGSIANRNSGGRMTTRSISRIIKERFVSVGLNSDRLTGHTLRHTAATLNLLAGGTVEETQQLLDHRDISTTMIYAHALDRAKNNSEKRIAGVIFQS